MNKLLDKRIKAGNAIIGIIILALGFINLSKDYIPIIGPYSLAITGLIAFIVTFGLDSIKLLFSNPRKPIKTFFIFFPISLIVSVLTSAFLIFVLKLNLSANPIVGNIPWLQLPFMLLGEELISFFVFVLVGILLRNNSKKILIASLCSAIVFALLHVPTYWNGSLLLTIFHVILLQGVARLIFNAAGIKSNTIAVPWLIHVLFDSFTLAITLFVK